MRAYLPSTMALLARVHAEGEVAADPTGEERAGHGVTPALRESFADGDLEELEYAALRDAASASLRLLAADPGAARRRVVLAVDVPDEQARPDAALGRSGIRVGGALPLERVAAVHVDDLDAEQTVAAAVAALPAADTGDDDAAFTVDEAEGFELLWFATQEIPLLLR